MSLPRRSPLEMFKFSIYLVLPVATIWFFNSPEMIRKLIETRQYIVFPPEGPKPPKGSLAELKAARDKGLQSNTQGNVSTETTNDASEPRKKWFGLF